MAPRLLRALLVATGLMRAVAKNVSSACVISSCSQLGAIVWSGGRQSKSPTPSSSRGCCVPSANAAARALVGLHIHVIGDSTLRMPVQYFGGQFVGCSSKPSHPLCVRNIHKFTPVYDLPMEGLEVSFEYNRFVSDMLRSQWWRLWVSSDLYKRPDAAARLPDIVVLGSWMWHASMGASLQRYEAELRAFLRAFVTQPSFEGWWAAPGRIFWREALPTERSNGHLQSSERCEAANAVAKRVLAELAPSVIWVSQSALLHHAGEPRIRTASSLEAMTKDGLHFHGPVQVFLMRHLLAVIAEGRERSTQAV